MAQAPQGKPNDDPSMEDILASIRRILNDGEADPEEPGPEIGTPAVPAAPFPPPAPVVEDVFMLDPAMLVPEPALASPEPDPPIAEPPPPSPPPVVEEPPPTPAPEPDPEPPHIKFEEPRPMVQPDPFDSLPDEPPAAEALLDATSAAAASASMGALVRVVSQKQTQVYRGGPTLEDMVRDEIRPLVKEWLDENLPPLVERMVRAEIERVTRGS